VLEGAAIVTHRYRQGRSRTRRRSRERTREPSSRSGQNHCEKQEQGQVGRMSQRAKAKQATYESETSVEICSAKATPAAMKMRSWTLMDGTRDKLTCEGREEDGQKSIRRCRREDRARQRKRQESARRSVRDRRGRSTGERIAKGAGRTCRATSGGPTAQSTPS
jgi:hypothetical protein